MTTQYESRSSAHRAARKACRKALNAPNYQAKEGPDYAIHPTSRPAWEPNGWYFELRGPAKDAQEKEKIDA